MLNTILRFKQDAPSPDSGNKIKALILISFLFGCSTMSTQRIQRPHVNQNILDPKTGLLLGSVKSEDLPISVCETELCLVLLDGEMRKIEEYVLWLETQNAACQK